MSFYRAAAKSALLAAALAASVGANAATTPITAIFGSGVGANDWTAETGGGVELGLRARLRLPVPTNTVNLTSGGTYTYNTGAHSLYTYTNLAEWNFDFSINAGTANVNAYTYVLGLDSDSGVGATYATIDPFLAFFDNSFGNAGTAQGAGVEASDLAGQAILAGANSIAQNSQNFGWLSAAFDPNVNGTYSLYLAAFNQAGDQVARTDITVIVGTGAVPEPASLALVGVALLGAAAAGRRRKA